MPVFRAKRKPFPRPSKNFREHEIFLTPPHSPPCNCPLFSLPRFPAFSPTLQPLEPIFILEGSVPLCSWTSLTRYSWSSCGPQTSRISCGITGPSPAPSPPPPFTFLFLPRPSGPVASFRRLPHPSRPWSPVSAFLQTLETGFAKTSRRWRAVFDHPCPARRNLFSTPRFFQALESGFDPYATGKNGCFPPLSGSVPLGRNTWRSACSLMLCATSFRGLSPLSRPSRLFVHSSSTCLSSAVPFVCSPCSDRPSVIFRNNSRLYPGGLGKE